MSLTASCYLVQTIDKVKDGGFRTDFCTRFINSDFPRISSTNLKIVDIILLPNA